MAPQLESARFREDPILERIRAADTTAYLKYCCGTGRRYRTGQCEAPGGGLGLRSRTAMGKNQDQAEEFEPVS